ncbi:Hypothetical_protein [Hexamita inflata]|uniref:Hypothetical_protein n=1 Tax=Hexamita inflata TaxID=28002 RepID=A0ABP1J042_9EUKA
MQSKQDSSSSLTSSDPQSYKLEQFSDSEIEYELENASSLTIGQNSLSSLSFEKETAEQHLKLLIICDMHTLYHQQIVGDQLSQLLTDTQKYLHNIWIKQQNILEQIVDAE